jgi:hypothetical protein
MLEVAVPVVENKKTMDTKTESAFSFVNQYAIQPASSCAEAGAGSDLRMVTDLEDIGGYEGVLIQQ